MKKWLINLVIKMISVESLASMFAQGIASLIAYGRKNSSDKAWDKTKEIVKQVKNWTTLFDEVYEDDTLTEEEEKKIQDAIADCTITTSIYNLIQNKKVTAKKARKTPAKKPAKKVAKKWQDEFTK